MKLANKNFLYSLLVGLVVTLVLALLIYILIPGLYVHYRGLENQQNAQKAFSTLQEKGSLYESDFSYGLNAFSLKIPNRDYKLFLSSAFGEYQILLLDPSLKALVDTFRSVSDQQWDMISQESVAGQYSQESQQILDTMATFFSQAIDNNQILKFQVQASTNLSNYSFNHFQILHSSQYSGLFQSSVYENSKQDEYSSFFGYLNRDDSVTLFLATTITPSITDVQPVLFNLILVMLPTVLLISLVASRWYSRLIIEPITKLSLNAQKRRHLKGLQTYVDIHGKDEIADLGQSLNLLYQAHNQQVMSLEESNQQRDLMLKAFSHQLKTPLVASRLLVDSMIQKVGKYSDSEKYLPEVKSQLDSMQQTVNQLLTINQLVSKNASELVPVMPIVDQLLKQMKVLSQEKNLKVRVIQQQVRAQFEIDPENLVQILTNLIGNAIEYTAPGGHVELTIARESIELFNYPAYVEPTLLAQLFDPFVSSKHSGKGHGLGLYVAKRCALASGYELLAVNKNEGVLFTLKKKGG